MGICHLVRVASAYIENKKQKKTWKLHGRWNKYDKKPLNTRLAIYI